MNLSPTFAVLDKAADVSAKDTHPCCLSADCPLLRTKTSPFFSLASILGFCQ